jgi:membrane-associated phospholipid phosphatase
VTVHEDSESWSAFATKLPVTDTQHEDFRTLREKWHERAKASMEFRIHFGPRPLTYGAWRCCPMTNKSFHFPQFFVALVFCFSFSAASVYGQEAVPAAVPTPGVPAQTTPSQPAERDVSWRKLPRNFLHDQKDIWLFPRTLTQGHHWVPTAAIISVTAGLVAADPQDARYFRRTATFGDFNGAFSGRNTALEMALVPATFYVVGLVRKDSYTEKTALLAGEAALDSTVLEIVMKAATHRLRPSDISPTGDFSDTFFRSHKPFSSSFPSGHTIDAFSIATVFARRYQRHRWVPWVAYGVAGTIGFSRITLQAHFPADVFLGAALGYSISRFAVLHGQ